MSNNEFKLLQLMFQLHALISDGKGDSDEAEEVRVQMESFETESLVEQFNTISCYCYALTEKDDALKKRYRELLFAETTDAGELDVIFKKSRNL